MQQSSDRPTLPDRFRPNMERPSNHLAMTNDKTTAIKTEMSNHEVTDGVTSHPNRWRHANDDQSNCDKQVKMEHEPNAGHSIDVGANRERGANIMGDEQTSDAKIANVTRAKLIYSCHRCKSTFNTRISFELHYK